MNQSETNAAIGQVLRMSRIDAGMSQDELADRLAQDGAKDLGTVEVVEATENGTRPLALTEAHAYADAVEIDIDEILHPHDFLRDRVEEVASRSDLQDAQERIKAIVVKRRRALRRIDDLASQQSAFTREQLSEIADIRRGWESLTTNCRHVTAEEVALFKKGWEAADAAGQTGHRVEAGFKALGFTIEGASDDHLR